MTRIVYLNGAFVPDHAASLPIFDRGLLFADAVYEGLGVLDGQIVDFRNHMARLRRSLGELSIPEPLDEAGFFEVLMRLVADNYIDEGFLYLHITRGTQERDYLYQTGLSPNVFAFTQGTHGQKADDAPRPVSLASTPDLRWVRRDIKTSNLLGQVLAKTAAASAGADEALMIAPDGTVTEGGCTSFFMVKGGEIYVRPLNHEILGGITRKTMLAVAAELGFSLVERPYRLDEALAADEAFLTGASSYVEPVGQIDGHKIGDGQAGPYTTRLRRAYLAAIRAGFQNPT
jgi:D-alanine transaminase